MRHLAKEYSYQGRKYCFDTLLFRDVIKKSLEQICDNSGKKMSRQELFEKIERKKGISASSLNHWYNGHNAPNEIEKVHDIADVLKIEWNTIVKENQVFEGENKMVNTEMIQKVEAKVEMPTISKELDYSVEINVIRDIYHDMVDFIEDFRSTTAFHYDEDVLVDYVRLSTGELIDMLYEADKKCKAISLKIKKAMLDISHNVYKKLELFVIGYLESCLGCEFADIWETGTSTDEELIASGYDLTKLNPYGRKFEGYITYCERKGVEDDISIRMEYVNYIADNAYVILEEILEAYIKK